MLDLDTWVKNKNVTMLISCIIGFGLAAILRPMCKGPDCVILRGPPVSQLREAVFQVGAKCHEFKPSAVACPTDGTKVVETFEFVAVN